VSRRFAISLLCAMLALSASARTRPRYGGTLRVEIEGDPWQRPGGIARRLVFDGLTFLDAKGAVRPALSVQWESDNDDHRWQFRLRPGVHFHDGTLMTAVNVAASLNTICNANCPWTAVHAVGSSLVFTSDSPMPNLPALLAGDEFLIALTTITDGTMPIGKIGTGPFQIAGSNNAVLTLTANDSCWQGRPFSDAVEIRTHRPIHDQWLDLSLGHTDIVQVPAEQLRQAQQQRLTIEVSHPAILLALQLSDRGPLANPMLRSAIASAVDRSALYNVIFQKQGELTASLLPQSLTGYAFLFPVDRDLNKAHELRGGLTIAPLSLTADDGGAMQLVAQRLALNLREAGFIVQVSPAPNTHADLVLRTLPLEDRDPAALLQDLLRNLGLPDPIADSESVALYKAEREFLDLHTVIPLLDLPRAYAVGGRVRDLRLRADGTPDLAAASLEDAP
jgi:peptide/nickel transport system substrate-binding protein